MTSAGSAGSGEDAPVIVILFHHLEQPADRTELTAAYHRVSAELSRVPGLLDNELFATVGDGSDFVVLSRWRDRRAFDDWEAGAGHLDATAPLRPWRDFRHGRPFGVHQRVAHHAGAVG